MSADNLEVLSRVTTYGISSNADLNRHLQNAWVKDPEQALAHSTLFDAKRVVACLAHPTALPTWRRLIECGRSAPRATVKTGTRHVELALLAVPLSGDSKEAGLAIEDMVSRVA